VIVDRLDRFPICYVYVCARAYTSKIENLSNVSISTTYGESGSGSFRRLVRFDYRCRSVRGSWACPSQLGSMEKGSPNQGSTHRFPLTFNTRTDLHTWRHTFVLTSMYMNSKELGSPTRNPNGSIARPLTEDKKLTIWK
jgi:hypothetical protein